MHKITIVHLSCDVIIRYSVFAFSCLARELIPVLSVKQLEYLPKNGRGISPVYEVSEVNITYETDTNSHPRVSVNYNDNEEPEEQHQEGDVIYTDYYIRKYSYQIILTYEIIVDDHTEQYESVSPFITHEPDTETDSYAFSDIDDTVISNKKVYIKDVTGIRRTTRIR